MKVQGWRLTGGIFLLLLVMTAVIFGIQTGEDAVRTLLRSTARCSLLLFLLAFSAASLYQLFPRPLTSWLRANRRYLGVSFALSHTWHLLALGALALWYPHPFVDKLTTVGLAGGGLAYVFIYAMTLTSFAAPRQWLGPRGWQRLHTFGSWYLWLIFLQSYLPRALKDPFYIPFVTLLLVVPVLRLARARRRQNAAV